MAKSWQGCLENEALRCPGGSREILSLQPGLKGVKARDAYIGLFAKACIEYAEKFYPSSYVILSAEYGFLFPSDIVPGPCNVTFKDPATNPITVKESGDRPRTRD